MQDMGVRYGAGRRIETERQECAALRTVIGYIKCRPGGADGHAVRLGGRGVEADNRAVRVDPEDGLEIELAGLVADIAGVGDINPSLAIVRTVPSRSVMETRRPPPVFAPSAAIKRPCASKIRPLARPLGARKTVTDPVTGSYRMIRSPMSENTIAPSPSRAPPSVKLPSPQSFSSTAPGATTSPV
jgi:hypothetical protein